MKILLAHNFYGSTAPSGENTAFVAEASLLRNRGHSIVEFTRHSDELLHQGLYGTVRGALGTIWNPVSLRKLKSTLRDIRPEIVHVHNTFIVRAVRDKRSQHSHGNDTAQLPDRVLSGNCA